MKRVSFKNAEAETVEMDPLQMTGEEIVLWFTQKTNSSFYAMKHLLYRAFSDRLDDGGSSWIRALLLMRESEFVEWLTSKGRVTKEELIDVLMNKLGHDTESRRRKIQEMQHGREISRALALLELSESATSTDIKRKYRALAKQMHPDVNRSNPDNTRQFHKVTDAYRLLLKAVAKDPREISQSDSLDQSLGDWTRVFSTNIGDFKRASQVRDILEEYKIMSRKHVTRTPPMIEIYVPKSEATAALSILKGEKGDSRIMRVCRKLVGLFRKLHVVWFA